MDMEKHMLLSISCFFGKCIEIINILGNKYLNYTHIHTYGPLETTKTLWLGKKLWIHPRLYSNKRFYN